MINDKRLPPRSYSLLFTWNALYPCAVTHWHPSLKWNITVCPTRYRTRLAGGPLLRVATIRRTTDTFLFISHTTNVLLLKFRCNISIGVRIIKEMPGSVASGAPCIMLLSDFRFKSKYRNLHPKYCSYKSRARMQYYGKHMPKVIAYGLVFYWNGILSEKVWSESVFRRYYHLTF
jgi:hypothetical protein